VLEGFCNAVEKKGYSAATIADIARAAHVSKRTFYEYFPDKEACFLAAYRQFADLVLQAVVAAVDPDASWELQTRSGVRAYLAALDLRPALTRVFFLEIHSAGKQALELRREVLERFAEQLHAFVEAARRRRPVIKQMSTTMAMALAGGLNELVLLKMEKGGRAHDLLDTALELVRAVIRT
jgi:AcrR family transcriptional regulator